MVGWEILHFLIQFLNMILLWLFFTFFFQKKTTYNLKKEPEIVSAFYFDLALRTFLAVK